QGLRRYDIGLVHEHERFTEAVAGTDKPHDLLAAHRRDEHQLDLSIDHRMKAYAGIAPVKNNFAACRLDLSRTQGNIVEFFDAQLVEQWHPGQKILDAYPVCAHIARIP